MARFVKILLVILACHTVHADLITVEQWQRWATRPTALQIAADLMRQIEDRTEDRTEGELILETPLELIGQFHKRPGNFILSIAAINYPDLDWGNARAPQLRLGFASLIAAIFLVRGELKSRYPKFRIVMNSHFENVWLGQMLIGVGFKPACDAILNGNASYRDLSWEVP